MAIEVACTDECRRVERDGTTIQIVKICDHPAPRVHADQPWTISVRVTGRDDLQTMDDPLSQFSTVAFITQCPECRRHFGAWWRTGEPVLKPSDEDVRSLAIAILVSEKFAVTPDAVTCPDCLDPDTDHRLFGRLLLIEGVPPERRHGWLTF